MGTSLKRKYEVIIIGAGPAGTVLAYELASRDIEVLVLEKERPPRYKCCAGGITVRTSSLLGTEFQQAFQDLVEDTIYTISISFKGDSLSGDYLGQPLVYTVMRDKFDHALMRRAEKAGANILTGYEVHEVRTENNRVEVITSSGKFESQFTIGADGSRSLVARTIGLRNGLYIVGLEREISVTDKELEKRKSRITVELGRISGGYSWIFPKSDHLSIGIECFREKAAGLKQQYTGFFHSLGLSGCIEMRSGGSLIPTCKGSVPVTRGRIALIGDAAGLADPLTGEGIHNAILSAQLAAPVIENSLKLRKASLSGYQQAIEHRVIPEIRISYLLEGILTQSPATVFEVLKDSGVWKVACRLLRGEANYATLAGKMYIFANVYPALARLRI